MTDVPARPLAELPTITLSAPPPDLETVSRPGRLILWRKRPRELNIVVEGRAGDDELQRPTEAPYQLAGQIRFASSRRYNARLFNVTLGGVRRPSLLVFRTPSAVDGDGGGVVSARLPL